MIVLCMMVWTSVILTTSISRGQPRVNWLRVEWVWMKSLASWLAGWVARGLIDRNMKSIMELPVTPNNHLQQPFSVHDNSPESSNTLYAIHPPPPPPPRFGKRLDFGQQNLDLQNQVLRIVSFIICVFHARHVSLPHHVDCWFTFRISPAMYIYIEIACTSLKWLHFIWPPSPPCTLYIRLSRGRGEMNWNDII